MPSTDQRDRLQPVRGDDMETLPRDTVLVRNLRPSDFDSVVHIDARNIGRRREQYFKGKLRQALTDTGIVVSLAAEIDGVFAGYLLARVYYGEFGEMEQAAVIDSIGVHPDFQRQGVGRALIDQLRTNLEGLGIRAIQTQVNWSVPSMLTFFHSQGFSPAPRFSLDLDLTKER